MKREGRSRRVFFWLAAALFFAREADAKKLKIVTTLPDFASLAQEIGGEYVQAESLASGVQNPHFVEAKPSLIIKLMKADLYIENGLQLEIGWAPQLVAASRNKRIQLGAAGHLDASTAIVPIEVPTDPTRAMGDIHAGGNPHYLLDPTNAKPVAEAIAKKLEELSPENAATFKAKLVLFEKKLDERMKAWAEKLDPYRGAKFVSYHKDFSYFARRFGFIETGTIEPKAGIPPTASHAARLIERMKAEGASFIVTQPWYEKRTPESIAQATGAKVVAFALLVGAVPQAGDYFSMMDYNVKSIAQALANQEANGKKEKPPAAP
ncbi:MAG: zinc ABC transporter substrate-binding protein [Elusimicrobia bacterium]|nr:zinc ABC transporter substrate-binding protein [Elusimicrobiota bacterium]